jgi:hypothetical protein
MAARRKQDILEAAIRRRQHLEHQLAEADRKIREAAIADKLATHSQYKTKVTEAKDIRHRLHVIRMNLSKKKDKQARLERDMRKLAEEQARFQQALKEWEQKQVKVDAEIEAIKDHLARQVTLPTI